MCFSTSMYTNSPPRRRVCQPAWSSGTKRTSAEDDEEFNHRSHESGPHSTRVFLLGDTRQPGRVSYQPQAGERRRHAPIQDAWTAWESLRPPGNAKKAIDLPDTMALQLMRAGDIEINPGPIALSSSGRRPDSRAKGRARLVARNRAGNNLEENKCRK